MDRCVWRQGRRRVLRHDGGEQGRSDVRMEYVPRPDHRRRFALTQATVSAHPNHVGVICTFGTGCARGTRNLLDLFEVAINLQSGKAAIIFTDDTLTTYTRSDGTVAPLPQVIVAWESWAPARCQLTDRRPKPPT